MEPLRIVQPNEAPESTEQKLNALAQAWRAQKRAEEQARDVRYSIEEQIAALLPATGTESTESLKTDAFKVAVAYGVTRKVDEKALSAAWASLQPSVQEAFRWKPEVSVAAMRALDDTDVAQFSRFVTTKPAKPSVKVEVL